MDPSELPLWLAIDGIRERDPRYAREAYVFVVAALGATVQGLPAERLDDPLQRHLSGGELMEGIVRLARSEFGTLAPTVFEEWGVRTGEDVGHIVFDLVEGGQLSARPEDTLDDFRRGPELLRALALPSRTASASQAGDG
jgi:uncharacterized repeat protein (TIGR04138 family)